MPGSPLHDLAARTTAVVLAGGNGTRLAPLTRHVCKPALPFGAGFRNIDFSLSNCVNSGIRTIGVPTQYKPGTLLRHLAAAWGSGANTNGAAVTPWPAEERAPDGGYRGTADAVFRNLELITACGHPLVLVLAGDHVYQMDYRPMLAQHRARRAAVTIGCVAVPAAEASQFGVLSLGPNDRIERFVEKPRTVDTTAIRADGTVLASMGIYVFDADRLATVLEADANDATSRHDFGADVLPRLIRHADAYAHPFVTAKTMPAYWRDVGTLAAYWRTHMDLLGREPRLRVDTPDWPLLADSPPPRSIIGRIVTAERGTLDDSLVADGCRVAGQVERSVLFAAADIARNAHVADSIVLPGASVGAACRLRGVIVDARYRVPDGTIIERHPAAGVDPAVLTVGSHADTEWRYATAP